MDEEQDLNQQNASSVILETTAIYNSSENSSSINLKNVNMFTPVSSSSITTLPSSSYSPPSSLSSSLTSSSSSTIIDKESKAITIDNQYNKNKFVQSIYNNSTTMVQNGKQEERQQYNSVSDTTSSTFNNENLHEQQQQHQHHYHDLFSDINDEDNNDTSDSEYSNLSGLSDISGQNWKPMSKPLNWIQKQINLGANPREILTQILSYGTQISPSYNDTTLWRILANILTEPPKRQKLKNFNTINDVVNALKTAKNIIVLTGAGVSVSCGIPDFRSNNGIYSRLAKDFPDLPDPQAMFDINYFSKDPRPFYKFAREIYPGQFKPSPCHYFIKLLEKKQKLLRNYTQNIDALERNAGIKNVIECHGSFATASCTKCKYKTTADEIRDDILAQRIPLCPKCHPNNKIIMTTKSINKIAKEATEAETTLTNDANHLLKSDNDGCGNSNLVAITSNNSDSDDNTQQISYSDIVQNGIMKPDIVFFGEGLSDAFHKAMGDDRDECDLLIVIGSSLKVRPVALIPSSIPPDVPQILINREQLNHLDFDVELLGDSDVIINHLCHMLGDDWNEGLCDSNILTETKQLAPIIENKHQCSQLKTNATVVLQNTPSFGIGDRSPFTDSGFDSSSSHPSIYTKATNNDENDRKNEKRNISIFNEQSSYQNAADKKVKENLLKMPSNSSIKLFDSKNNVGSDSDDNINNHKDKLLENKNSMIETTQGLCPSVVSSSSSSPSSSSAIESHKMPSLAANYSIADRLYENTYYYNSLSSYIFPGAQVFWNLSTTAKPSKLSLSSTSSEFSDSSDIEDDDEKNLHHRRHHQEENDEDDLMSDDNRNNAADISNSDDDNDNIDANDEDDNDDDDDENFGGFPPQKRRRA